MSIKLMTAVYESALEKSIKAVALALADHAHDDGTNIFPSVDYTAWKTGYSDRSVQRATRELLEIGILVQDGIHFSGAKVYRIIAEKLPKRPPYKPGDKMSPGDTVSPLPVTLCHPTGDTVSPKPLVNHQIQPSTNGHGIHNGFREAVRAYEDNISMITPIVSDSITSALADYPDGWVVEAIAVAAGANKRSWRYIDGILRNWKVKGYPDIKSKVANQKVIEVSSR